MDETRFKELLKKLKGILYSGIRVFTWEDLESMTSIQLSELTLEMMIRFTGPGSYSLFPELYDLIEYLDKKVSIREDPSLEKYLHMTASLICLTQLEGADFGDILPARLVRHLERIIGLDPFKVGSMETQPSIQIATFPAYTVLEGVVRRKLSQFISLQGEVLQEFTVNTKRGGGIYNPGRRKTDCKVTYTPKKQKGKKHNINMLNDELRLLEQQTKSPDLKAKLSYLDKSEGLFDEIQDWRWPLLHGVLTASWHGITLLLLAYLILLEV